MATAALPRVALLGEATFEGRPGGMTRYVEELAASLRAAGGEPRLLVIGPDAATTPGGFGTAADGQRPEARVATSLRAPLGHRLLAFRRAAAGFGADVDVVDAHFALYAALPLFTTSLRRRPLVVHFHGPWADETAISRGLGPAVPAKRVVERAVYRRADRVVVLSQAFSRLVVDRYGVDPGRVVVIPPGVDLDRFRPGDQAAARARFGVADGSFTVVAVRRLDPRMGLDTLLDAWDRVQGHHPTATLLIAGDGPARAALAARRDRLPRPPGVRLLGRVDDEDLASLYRAADCTVVPSRALEGFGLVALESMACGTPAVVTDVGGLPEAVAGADASLVVPPSDPARLADRLLRVAAGERPSAVRCRVHAEGFRWAEVAGRHLDLYAEVATRSRPRVVFVDHCARASGAELAMARLVAALDVEAHVVLGEDGPLVGPLQAAGASVEVLPMAAAGRDLRRQRVRLGALPAGPALSGVAYTLRLARRLRRLRPDVVHTNSLKAALYGGVAGRLAGVPVVWHLRDRIDPGHLPPAAVRLVRAAARILPSAVIANSAATLATLGGVAGTVVPSPVEAASRHPPVGSRRVPGPLTVGMIGRLASWKGQDVFVDAFARAFAGGDERAVIVGAPLFGREDEAYAAAVRRQVDELGLADRIEFRGHVDDVAAVHADLDMLVHASTLPEPFGLAVAEGLAAGLPVVAAGAGGPAEIVTDGVDGLLFPPGDADALAARLVRLAGDPLLRSRLGAAGRRRAAAFAPEEVAARVTAVYRRVLSGDRVGAAGPAGSRVSAVRKNRLASFSDGASSRGTGSRSPGACT